MYAVRNKRPPLNVRICASVDAARRNGRTDTAMIQVRKVYPNAYCELCFFNERRGYMVWHSGGQALGHGFSANAAWTNALSTALEKALIE